MQLPKPVRNILLFLAFLWIVQGPIVEIFVDWLWFESMGYLEVFQTKLTARLSLWVAGFAMAVAFVGLNIRHALKQQPLDYDRISVMMADLEIPPDRIRSLVRIFLGLWVVLPALFFGGVAQANWLEVLVWMNRVDFGVTEPIWGLDVGFYVFELPVWRLAHGMLVALFIVSLLPVALLYVGRDLFILRATPRLSKGARQHVLILLGSLFVLFGIGWWMDRFDLLTSQSGAVWGVSYTDLNARVPGYWVMMGASFLVAALFFASIRQRSWRPPAVGVGSYFVVRILITALWPSLVQDYIVKPNEFEREKQFIIDNIVMTRAAYGIGDIEVRDFPASGTLSWEDIENNKPTIDNVRIWDTRPLLTTYGELQEIRPYYEMVDVDVDRYVINGKSRQVMLSPRELDYTKIPGAAQSWVNEHIFYTHGYGLTMSPVNEVSGEAGRPSLFLQNIPPEVSSTPKTELTEEDKERLRVDQPGIYYGELSNNYVLVKTGEQELDYADDQSQEYTTYDGQGGVGIGSLARKLLFSLHFNDIDIMLSQYLQPESRILFRRQIVERVRTLAPFLELDSDPYMVVTDGKLVFMIDAYTTASAYPYSEPTQVEGRGAFNYMRNSVKVVVDAYEGSVDLYINDVNDPIIQVYSKIFPTAFKSMDLLSDDLKSHIRYPSDLFDVQANMYRAYHMTDPLVFYNMEDMWEIPRELYAGQEQPVESYYLIMKLPPDENSEGTEEEEFILLLPFNPAGKPNMTAWMAAHCDYGENYGKLVLYQFNRSDFYDGPRQIEAQIDQNVEISEWITLRNQSGSRVVRGNLLVIPIQESLIYVEPLYLQAEQGKIPELKKVIVYYSDPQSQEEYRVVMRPTLDDALRELFEPQERDRLTIEAPKDQTVPEVTIESGASPSTAVQNLNEPSDGLSYRRQVEQRALTAHRLLAELVAAEQSGDGETHRLKIDQLIDVIQSMKTASQGGGQPVDGNAEPVDAASGVDGLDASGTSAETSNEPEADNGEAAVEPTGASTGTSEEGEAQ